MVLVKIFFEILVGRDVNDSADYNGKKKELISTSYIIHQDIGWNIARWDFYCSVADKKPVLRSCLWWVNSWDATNKIDYYYVDYDTG